MAMDKIGYGLNGSALSRLANRMIKEQDVDESGDLIKKETKLTDEAFNRLDKNGDGTITKDELKDGLNQRKGDVVSILSESPENLGLYTPKGLSNHVVNTLDEDKDGKLNMKESQLEQEEFNAVDTNEDGMLSREEIEASMQAYIDEFGEGEADYATRAKEQSERVLDGLSVSLINELDKDDNGNVSREESPLSDELFSEIDTNGDGVISAEEIRAAMSDNPEQARRLLSDIFGPDGIPGFTESWMERSADNLLASFDKDANGTLSLEESGMDKEAFAAMDSDGDGILTRDDLIAELGRKAEAAKSELRAPEKGQGNEPQHGRPAGVRRAMASYEGRMGDLMADVFNRDQA